MSSRVSFWSPFTVHRRHFTWHNPCKAGVDNRASSKLFADAEQEDSEQKPPLKIPVVQRDHENWTGEESTHDAVLRMLMDKYKPLRVGTIRTADEKLRQAPPRISRVDFDPAEVQGPSEPRRTAEEEVQNAPGVVLTASSALSTSDEPLLPAVEGHRPWHTTFKTPSHASSSIKYGSFPSLTPSSSRAPAPSGELDDRARRKEKEAKKRSLTAGRLTRAKESTLDYRLGIKTSHANARPNPVSMRGWGGLVEERIERARLAGHFRSIKGRGEPIKRQIDEGNPFIAREEYLMNRIVQRQGAAPPWVEIQGELETAVAAFREVVRQSWTRRAVRMLTASQPAALLPALSLRDVAALRDAEWEARERAYHDSALAEINSLVRKYNALAPYAVRRPYYVREAELGKAYEQSGEDILAGIGQRTQGASIRASRAISDEDEGGMGAGGHAIQSLRVRDVVRSWFRWKS
ncbi:hypothetical protein BV25DRAFT_1821485 [Artomyces pyxidatus]|uniref:Uncharacterized protein n=1 Tax=Artomyces pyxidatus TaxID=48021 RepID=A0ACB8TA53_9AGAM|nr:hypothetical protein BV25DRAFT_1821485 [Artomyces pyxidatus]